MTRDEMQGWLNERLDEAVTAARDAAETFIGEANDVERQRLLRDVVRAVAAAEALMHVRGAAAEKEDE